MLPGAQQRRRDVPGVTGDCLVLAQVGGVPGESLPDGVPVDPELAGDLLLAGVPVAGLEELDDRDSPVAGDARGA